MVRFLEPHPERLGSGDRLTVSNFAARHDERFFVTSEISDFHPADRMPRGSIKRFEAT